MGIGLSIRCPRDSGWCDGSVCENVGRAGCFRSSTAMHRRINARGTRALLDQSDPDKMPKAHPGVKTRRQQKRLDAEMAWIRSLRP